MFGRRALVGGVLGGGALVAAPAAAAPAASARVVRVKRLRAGDLVLGPSGNVVRVTSREALGEGRFEVVVDEPATGRSLRLGGQALDGSRQVVVLARGVPAGAVHFEDPAPAVVDGGAP